LNGAATHDLLHDGQIGMNPRQAIHTLDLRVKSCQIHNQLLLALCARARLDQQLYTCSSKKMYEGIWEYKYTDRLSARHLRRMFAPDSNAFLSGRAEQHQA